MQRATLAALILISLSVFCFGQETVVFESGQGGSASYRIPAMIGLRSGKILAFAEGRKNGASDFGDIDIVLRTSADNGKTWSEIKVVAENGMLQAGNPAPVVDQLDGRFPKGRIFLFYNTGNTNERETRKGNGLRGVWYKTSTDEGETWSTAVNITSRVKHADWRAFANTPGHALQIKRGKYKGRLFVPINYSKGGPANNFDDYMASAFYSDDHGATFKLSNDIGVKGSNESTAAELSDNGVLLNARNQKGDEKHRIFARSSDGGTTWNEIGFDRVLIDPVCQGSLLNIEGRTIAFSNNADQENRDRLTLRISFDEGRTWAKSIVIDGIAEPNGVDQTAYSDIVRLDKESIGILYEKEDYKKIVFKHVRWK